MNLSVLIVQYLKRNNLFLFIVMVTIVDVIDGSVNTACALLKWSLEIVHSYLSINHKCKEVETDAPGFVHLH